MTAPGSSDATAACTPAPGVKTLATTNPMTRARVVTAATNPGPASAAYAPTSNSSGSTIQTALAGAPGRLALRASLAAARGATAVATTLPNRLLDSFSRRNADFVSMGGLTVVSNVYGNPAVSIPAGTLRGLPVGLQVLTKHHQDELLFDLALVQERQRPWPLVAPAVTVRT